MKIIEFVERVNITVQDFRSRFKEDEDQNEEDLLDMFEDYVRSNGLVPYKIKLNK